MRIKEEKRPSPRMESFALTDIVMNILIFFLIAFGLLYTFSEKLTKVDLPEVSQKEKTSGILIRFHLKKKATFDIIGNKENFRLTISKFARVLWDVLSFKNKKRKLLYFLVKKLTIV